MPGGVWGSAQRAHEGCGTWDMMHDMWFIMDDAQGLTHNAQGSVHGP